MRRCDESSSRPGFYNQATTRTDRLAAVLDKAITEIHQPAKSVPDPERVAGYRRAMMLARQREQSQRSRGLEYGD